MVKGELMGLDNIHVNEEKCADTLVFIALCVFLYKSAFYLPRCFLKIFQKSQ